MFEPRFNSRAVITKRRPAAQQTVARSNTNDFDPIDMGFEDIAAGPDDVCIAPGLVAHFGRFPSGSANRNYYALPALERISAD